MARRIVFYGLLTAHLIECIIYRDKILQSKDAPIIAFGMTILFGIIYLGYFLVTFLTTLLIS